MHPVKTVVTPAGDGIDVKGKEKPKNPTEVKVVKRLTRYTLGEFAYRVAELPIELARNDPDFTLLKTFCMEQQISCYESDKYTYTHTLHPVDGRVIRSVSTQRGISAAILLLLKIDPNCQQFSITDCWGSARTAAILNKAAGGLYGDYKYNSRMFKYDCLAAHYDAKDMLRAGKRSLVMGCDVAELASADILVVQDVQQSSTTRDNIFELVLKCKVLVLIGHIEKGAMGRNGYHGFYIRREDGIHNWASSEDPRYLDTEDLVWLTESTACLYKGHKIIWCLQQIYGNSVFCVFTRSLAPVHPSKYDWTTSFKEVSLEVTNPDEPWLYWRGLGDMLSYVSSARAVYEKGIVFEPIALAGQSFLSGKSMGASLDRQLDSYVEKEMRKNQAIQVMMAVAPQDYLKLLTFTIAYSRRLEVERLYEVARLGVNQSNAIAQSNRYRNLSDRNRAFDRWGCCAIMTLPCVSVLALTTAPCSIFGWLLDDIYKRESLINASALVESSWPPGFQESVEEGRVCVKEGVPGVYARKQLVCKKRAYTQTPVPQRLRLGPNGRVVVKSGGEVYEGWPCDANLLEEPPAVTYTYHYGPLAEDWHCNMNSVGGAIGMVNALLTEMTGPNGELCTAEDNARAWGRVGDSVTWNLEQSIPVYVSDELRMEWCKNHSKHAIYVPALEAVIRMGAEPYSGYADIIPKTNELMKKEKERIIVTPGPSCVAFDGYEIDMVSRRAKTWFGVDNFWNTSSDFGMVKGFLTLMLGTTPEERGRWYDLAAQIPDESFAIAVGGDDLAAFLRFLNFIFAVESDASNWDHTMVDMEIDGEKYGARQQTDQYMKAFGASDSLLDRLARIGEDGLVWRPHRKSKTSIKVVLGYGRMKSGQPSTSIETSFGMAHNMANLFAELRSELTAGMDRDEIISHVKEAVPRLGWKMFRMKLKVKVLENPRRMTFYKGYFVRSRVGGVETSVWYPSPEIFMKLGASESNPDNNIAYKAILNRERMGLVKAKSKDLARHLRVYDVLNANRGFLGLPVFTALYRSVRPPVRTSVDESVDRLATLDKWDKPMLTSVVTDQDWADMLEDLEIAPLLDDFNTFMARIDWTPGMFITHPLVRALADRYG